MTIRDIRVVQLMGWRTGDDGRIRREPVNWTLQILRDGSDTFEDVKVLYCEEEADAVSENDTKAPPRDVAGSGDVQI